MFPNLIRCLIHKLVQTGSSLNALNISWETSKARRSYLFLFRFMGIIRGKKLLFRKKPSFFRLAILVKS